MMLRTITIFCLFAGALPAQARFRVAPTRPSPVTRIPGLVLPGLGAAAQSALNHNSFNLTMSVLPTVTMPKVAVLPAMRAAQVAAAPLARLQDTNGKVAKARENKNSAGVARSLHQLYAERTDKGAPAVLAHSDDTGGADFAPSGAEPITAENLPGRYRAKIAIPGPYFAAELVINEDKTYTIQVANIENVSPKFEGTWEFKDGKFRGVHQVPGLGPVRIAMDMSQTNTAALESETGVVIDIESDMFGGEPLPFRVAKNDEPFFPERTAQD